MIHQYFLILYIALPAFVANMVPIIATKLDLCPRLNTPLDNGVIFRGRRLLGKNKTVRGLFFGTVCGALISSLQHILPFLPEIKFTTLSTAFLFGALAGFGALVGDALASIIKRQLDIASGKPFIPLDQIDYIIGFLIFTFPIMHWTWQESLFLLIFALIANPLINITAYFLGIKKTYW